MALNTFGVGAEISATDNASKAMQAVSSSTLGMAGAFGQAGSGLGGMLGLAGQMPAALSAGSAAAGGLAAALGPIVIGIGAIIAALSMWNDVATRTNMILQTSISAFTQYESALAEVQTILGVTRTEMDAVTDSALSFGATYGKAPTEELKAFYQTASAGFDDAAQAALVMDTSNKLAVGGVTDLASATDLLTTVLNGFGIEAKDSMSASDALFTGVRAGKTTVGELATAFGNVVSPARTLGAELDESIAAMATLTLGGLSTAEASTALARAFDVLIKKPPGMIKAFDDFGVKEKDLDVRGRGLQAVLLDIGKAFKGNEEEIAKAIPQIRAFKAILPLASTQADKFAEILGKMEDKAGATDQAFNIIANTLDFQKKRWASMTEAVRIRIGQVFAPAIKRALDVLNDLLGLVEKLPSSMKTLIFAMGGIGLAVPSVINKIAGFAWTLTKLAVVAVPVVSAIGFMAPSLLTFGASIVQTTPFIGRIVQLFVAWKDNVGGLQERVAKFFENFKLALRGLGAAITGEGQISGPLADDLEKAGITQWVAGLFTLFRRLQVFMDEFWGGFRDAALAGIEGFSDIFPMASKWLKMLTSEGEGAGRTVAKIFPIEKVKEWGQTAGRWLGAVINWLAEMGKNWEENAITVGDFVTNLGKGATALSTLAEIANRLLPVADALGKSFEFIGFGEPALAGPSGGGGFSLPEFSLPTQPPGVTGKNTPATSAASAPSLPTVNLQLTSRTELDGKVLAEVVQQKQFELAEESQQQE